MKNITASLPTPAAILGIPDVARKSKSRTWSGRGAKVNTVGWAFMYDVLCTCITAPLEGLFVDRAKYSENVGHHLDQTNHAQGRKDIDQNSPATTRTSKNQIEVDASNGTHPLTRWRLGECVKNNNVALGNFQRLT